MVSNNKTRLSAGTHNTEAPHMTTMNTADDTTKPTAGQRRRVKDEVDKLLEAEAKLASRLPAVSSMQDMLDPVRTMEVAYDWPAVDSFLDRVFHHPMAPDENMVTWAVAPATPPMSPISDVAIETEILAKPRYTRARACYFGTSTVKLTDAGKLSHATKNFHSMRVLVLDDIGTKIPFDKFTDDFQPTYKIESSAGNYQYGYVLEEPLREVEHAKALVQLAYESGMSDEGGKVPIKAVRLPAGVNGKKGEKSCFLVRLESMDGPLWTPEKILQQLDVGVEWSEVEADADAVAKKRAGKMAGASLWSAAKEPSLSGVVDPVLEWVMDSDQYLGDTGTWVTVKCPNALAHTDGSESAGYIPLGRGNDPVRRAFKCFHGHCGDIATRDYLQFVAAAGGPVAAVVDTAAALTSTWIFDAAEDAVWKIRGCREPIPMSMSAFRNLHPRKIAVTKRDGEEAYVSEHALWLHSPSRVNVYGRTYAPNDPSLIVEVDGHAYVNMFSPPAWGTGEIEQHDVDMFTDFITYLIPAKDERKYFLDWLSCKVKDMGFRGAAIVMIAKMQGTGRTTLSDMIKAMFGACNVTNVPFDNMVGDNAFNEWMESPIVTTDETLNTGATSFYRTYERLKELIDPRPKLVTINPKFGKKRRALVHSSFLFFSNHADALSLGNNDRRFYVLDNAAMPAPPAYYTALNQWLDELDDNNQPRWAASIWRWLTARDVDVEELLAPPTATASKRTMLASSKSSIEVVMDAALEHWHAPHFAVKQIEDVISTFAGRLRLHEIAGWEKVLKRLIKNKTRGYSATTSAKIKGKNIRPRLITSRMKDTGAVAIPLGADEKPSVEDRRLLAEDLRLFTDQRDEILCRVSDALDLADL